MLKRTKLRDRSLPVYSIGEEITNTATHVIGGLLGIVALILCVRKAALCGGAAEITGAAIYGSCLVILYSASSVYHGLRPSTAKKVMQILDHCAIYFLIAGSYSIVCLGALRRESAALGWSILGMEWTLCAVATVLTAIDLKKYNAFSMICYIGMGWCIIVTIVPVYKALTFWGFVWLLAGGIMYTIGAILYGIGSKVRYIHSIFHIFVVLASVMHFICILFFVI